MFARMVWTRGFVARWVLCAGVMCSVVIPTQQTTARAAVSHFGPAEVVLPPGSTNQVRIDQRVVATFELKAYLSAELERLPIGKLVFNPPDTMQVGVNERVEFAVTRGDAVTLLRGLRGRGKPQVEDIEVGTLMKAVLDGGDSFKVRPLNSTEQPVIGDRATPWAWEVLPLESGEHQLHLTVAVRVKVPGDGEEARDYPVKDKTVKVRVNPVYSIRRFLQANFVALLTFAGLWELIRWLGRLGWRKVAARLRRPESRIIRP